MSDFNAIMHQIRFRLGLCPRLRWGAYNAPPDFLAGFERPTSKRSRKWGGKEGWEKGWGRRREQRVGKGRKGKGRRGICLLLNLGLATPLIGWFGLVRGHPTSLKIAPFDRARTTSYSSLIETIRLSCTVYYQNVTMLRSGLCCRNSVCLSVVCRLSVVCNVGAPYSEG